jgi:hypothetical protein
MVTQMYLIRRSPSKLFIPISYVTEDGNHVFTSVGPRVDTDRGFHEAMDLVR